MSKLAELPATLDGIEAGDFEGRDVDRLRIIEAAKKLLSRVETVEERMFDITFTQPAVFSAMQTLLDLGLWKQWMAIGGAPTSVEGLCELCTPRCDANLLHRLLRLLASVHIIEETHEGRYGMAQVSFGDASRWIQSRTHHWDMVSRNFPAFLAKTGYEEPRDPDNNNYMDCNPEGLGIFGRCVAEPAYQESFSVFMKGWAVSKLPWPEFYDTGALVDGADLGDGGVLCVDVGGHHGIDLTRLLEKHPDLPAGSLVLQDLPDVVSQARDLNDKIKVMPHDMFQPQPIKGSRSYFFHAVFHDWPDSVATRILGQITAVMKKGYSRVLIVDIVVPVTGASAIQSAMDVQMMAICSAGERTESMWTGLIEGAGLKIIKMWEDGRGNERLIEAELA